MAKKKPQTAPNLHCELDAALGEWLDNLAHIPSRMMWWDLSTYYPHDALKEIERKLQIAYAEYQGNIGDIIRRLNEDELLQHLRTKLTKEVLRWRFRRKHGDYSEKDEEAAKGLVDLDDIFPLVEEIADAVAKYKALEDIRPLLEARLPGKRSKGRPKNILMKRMLRHVFLAAYETFTGTEFDFYPITFKGSEPQIVKPLKRPAYGIVMVKGYLQATKEILSSCGEHVSIKALEKVRDELRGELIIGPIGRSGLGPVREFYQSSTSKKEKTFLIDWVMSIGLYKHRKTATKFLESPVT